MISIDWVIMCKVAWMVIDILLALLMVKLLLLLQGWGVVIGRRATLEYLLKV